VADGDERPLRGVRVAFSDREQPLGYGVTDEQGRVSFTVAPSMHLGVTATFQNGRFPIQIAMRPRSGVRVRLHAYPSTTNANDAKVSLVAAVVLERVPGRLRISMSIVSFVSSRRAFAEDTSFAIPEQATNFETHRNPEAIHIERTGAAVRLFDTLPPGRREGRLTFEIPAPEGEAVRLALGLPTGVETIRVGYLNESSAANIEVEGFEKAQRDSSVRAMLYTTRECRGAADAPDKLAITVR